MRSPRYPLEPLAQLRDRQVDDAARHQAELVRARQVAESAKQTAEYQRAAHEGATSLVRAAESQALARGELRAGDLVRADSWYAQRTAETRTLEAAVERAGAIEKAACDAERAAQAKTAARKADAQIVANDRARWEDARRRKIEASEEETLEDACRPAR